MCHCSFTCREAEKCLIIHPINSWQENSVFSIAKKCYENPKRLGVPSFFDNLEYKSKYTPINIIVNKPSIIYKFLCGGEVEVCW